MLPIESLLVRKLDLKDVINNIVNRKTWRWLLVNQAKQGPLLIVRVQVCIQM